MAKDLDKKFAEFRKKKAPEVPKKVEPPKEGFFSRFKHKPPVEDKKTELPSEEKKVEPPEEKKAEAPPEEKKAEVSEKAPEEKKTEAIPKIGLTSIVKGWRSKRKISKLESKVKEVKGKDEKAEKAEVKDIRKTLQKVRKEQKKKKLTAAQRRRRLKGFLEMAGWEDVLPHTIARHLFRVAIGLTTIGSLYLAYFFAMSDTWYPLTFIFTLIGFVWTIGFILALLILWMGFYMFLDLKMFRRKLAMEMVLPDFLQLTSANIRAGMPTDQALWYAVRPRFGVLAKEIETVAKETLSGTDLNSALYNFANKYDSLILKRSISLLIEGINAGGEIGDLLNKISLNIQETRIMKKEMAASVTTYVIFISFATAMAAPVLFALSAQLLTIIKDITSKMAGSNLSGTGGLSFSISGDAVSLFDFKIFAVVSLIITSFSSSVIVAIIKKGSVKEGITYIPLFIVVTLAVFFLALKILGGALGGLI